MSADQEPMETDQSERALADKTILSRVLEALSPLNEQWEELGAKLGLKRDMLDSLSEGHKDAAEQMRKVFNEWAGRDGVEVVELLNAVKSWDENVADSLKEIVDGVSPADLHESGVEGQEKEPDNEVKNEQSEDSKEKDDDTQMESKDQELTPPDVETQKKELQPTLKQQLKKGDTWFLVDIRWIKQWKKYVGFDTWDQSSAGKPEANPGPLDNSNLFKDDKLREHLMDELDYYLIPEGAWNKLASWYGLSTGSKVLSRKVVEYGLYMKHCKVEVYLLEFKLCVHPQLNELKKGEFSRADTVADLERVLKEEFGVPTSSECRVWHRYMTHTYELLQKSDQTLQDAGLYTGQTIVLEKKNEDGSWPRTTSTVSSTTHSTRSSDDSFSSSSASRSTGSSYGGGGSYWSYGSKPADPGLCGLSNLGNTCFMNSALQCLSNTAPLTEYFLGEGGDEKPYKKHINKDNPLGMGGAIAQSYGALLEEIWSGKCSVTAPRNFKTYVSRYAPQFVGFAQHDSQELLAFLLDGLHEDLNLIKKKPYVDMTVETKDRPEKDIAEEIWYKYLQRNQSVIVKLFQGQLRSTLQCPQCQGISKTFDPFMFLSLPLPVKKTRSVLVYLVRTNPMEPVTKYKLQLPKRGCVSDLKKELSALSGVESTHLAVVDVYNSRFHRIYSDRDPLSTIMDRDDIYCYQLENEIVGNRKMVHVPVYLRAETEQKYSYQQHSRYYTLFGLPTVAYVPTECTYRTLYTAIVSKMRRYVKLWSEVKDLSDNKSKAEEEGKNNTEPNNNGNESSEVNHVYEESSADPPENMEVDGEAANKETENNEENKETENNEEMNKEAENNSNEATTIKESKKETPKNEEMNKDSGERDLFRLVVVNSYGSQEIKKLADDPKRPLQLSGSTYIACDWDSEVKDKCYDDEKSKEWVDHESCGVVTGTRSRNIQLMDCFELFTVTETLGKDDEWYCPQCKEHVRASKKFDLWTLPDILVIHLKRFSYDRYWRDKLDVLVEFPVTGLDLSTLVQSPDKLGALYDLYAVSNHFGGMGGGHYTAYAKNKNDNKWYNFDDSHVSETSDDRLVTAAAYVLFYHRRENPGQPTRRSVLDRSLSESFAELDENLKAKYVNNQESKRSKNDEQEVFSEADEDNNTELPSTNMDEPD